MKNFKLNSQTNQLTERRFSVTSVQYETQITIRSQIGNFRSRLFRN